MDVDSRKKFQLTKYITNGLTDRLRKLDSPMHKSYLNTFYCSTSLTVDGDDVLTNYCKNRFCLTCCRIKTGKMINEYLPSVINLKDPWFVTLTVPNVGPAVLHEWIFLMNVKFRKLKDRMYRENRLFGIRKLEVTYNQERNDYHPHYHVIVESKAAAVRLLELWLEEFSYWGANEAGQDLRPADIGSIKEVFKYFTKLHKGKVFYPAENLDLIFQSLRGNRVFFTYGLKKAAVEKKAIMNDAQKRELYYLWSNTLKDWVNCDGHLFGGLSEFELIKKQVKGEHNEYSEIFCR